MEEAKDVKFVNIETGDVKFINAETGEVLIEFDTLKVSDIAEEEEKK